MRFGLFGLALLVGLPAAATPLRAQEAPYLDDRSSPQALVRSLYNAINRKEFARAYGYFANPPSPTLEDYAKGYEDTESVSLVVGTPAAEGAAGSTFYSLPVAISASGANEQVFAGCYTLRLANPQVQGQPFVPLSIEKGSLAPVAGPLESALPASCPEGPPLPAQNLAIERATQKFLTSRMDSCQVEEGNEPKAWDIGFHYATDAADAEESKVTLIQFFCTRGAYNEVYAYYVVDTIGEVKELHFAEPDLDIRYENDDSEGKLESMTVIGFKTTNVLINSEYDPETKSISSWSKWRGVGDASSTGRWIFREGDFALVHFEVDPTYNGEIDPQSVLDYDTGP